MTRYELLPEGATPAATDAHQLVWLAESGDGSSVRANVDPWLTHLGTRSEAAIDLVRAAAGAYMADRLTPRGAGFSRTLHLHVRVIDARRWAAAANQLADILHWLTGDTWLIEMSEDHLARPDPSPAAAADAVALLSGGLDSFCGAILSAERQCLRLGHWDNTTVKGAQDRSWAWIRDKAGRVSETYRQVRVTQAEEKREASTRSRTLLFIALAIAAADAVSTSGVEIPENGFTSLNPPLAVNRGGALSTRSTHPWTLSLTRRLLSEVGIEVGLLAPYMGWTKGELLSAAAGAGVDSFCDGAAKTLSCGKLDGRLYRGGNPNHHCGLCVPCLVRRGAFIAAGVRDNTAYLVQELNGLALKQLIERRSDDVGAVRLAVSRIIDDVDVMAQGPFPEEFDLDNAVELCNRGLQELAAVPLP